MNHEIITEKFTEGCVDSQTAKEFPLIAAMAAKNDFTTGCYIEKLVVDGETVSMAIVDPDGYPLNTKLCAFEVKCNARGRGYGKELLHYIITNYEDVRAVVLREAIGFYRKCFFKIVEDMGGQVLTVEAIA